MRASNWKYHIWSSQKTTHRGLISYSNPVLPSHELHSILITSNPQRLVTLLLIKHTRNQYSHSAAIDHSLERLCPAIDAVAWRPLISAQHVHSWFLHHMVYWIWLCISRILILLNNSRFIVVVFRDKLVFLWIHEANLSAFPFKCCFECWWDEC